VVSPAAAPVQRMIRHARDEGLVIDLTAGRRTRSVAILKSGEILLLGLTQRELGSRGLPLETPVRRRRARAS
jgi:extracellular matrix regulatory protein A